MTAEISHPSPEIMPSEALDAYGVVDNLLGYLEKSPQQLTDKLVSKIAGQEHINSEKVKEGVQFATLIHTNQKRATGQEYITHPLAAALVLIDMLGVENVSTGDLVVMLNHDTVEDCKPSTPEKREEVLFTLANKFGQDRAVGVLALTHKALKADGKLDEEAQIENLVRFDQIFPKSDVNLFAIRVAERAHNTIHPLNPTTPKLEDKRQRTIQRSRAYLIPNLPEDQPILREVLEIVNTVGELTLQSKVDPKNWKEPVRQKLAA